MGAPAGGFHDPRAAAGHDHNPSTQCLRSCRPDDPAKFSGDLVIAALGRNALRDRETAAQSWIAAVRGDRLGASFYVPSRSLWLGNASAAKDDNRVGDVVLLQQAFRLQIIDLQSNAPRYVLLQKLRISIGFTIARRGENGFQCFGCKRVVLMRLGSMPRE